ncbi:hypothetical protein KKC32_04350 [Patescibacteria group bacterium]|nr:hypothetical protein [Patescibacteria group bacterium]
MSPLRKKIYISIFICEAIALMLIAFFGFLQAQSFASPDFQLGVTFSKSYSQYLGLDWKQTYLAILDDLQVKTIRISAPWNEIEPKKWQRDYRALDWQVTEAEKRGVAIIFVLGRRTPHWPECHNPLWINDLPEESVKDYQISMMKQVIERYRKYENIKMWQVENEPFLNIFGECPPSDIDFLRKEISLVKTLDSRPVLITDSGELSSWVGAANIGDLFGTSIYRTTYNKYFGYWSYNFPPVFYWLKARLVGLDPGDVIIAELQAEPWLPRGIKDSSIEEQKKFMMADDLRGIADYSRKTGFSSAYLWGAEWWYYLMENYGDYSMWETAREIFNQ